MMNNESGRSMVEMLGVLAIIGVLSVGGIAGYTQAMKKYKINEALNEISMAAVLCATGQGAAMPKGKFATTLTCESKTGVVSWDVVSGIEVKDVQAALQTVGKVDGKTFVLDDNASLAS